MKYLMILIMLGMTGCTGMRPITECKSTCASQKVEFFKDETCECKCNIERSIASYPEKTNNH